MQKTGLIIFVVILFLFISCEKKPEASFKTDKIEYVAGERVILTNTSESGSSFEWILPEGKTETTKATEFVINPNSGFDEINITLVAKSKLHCKRNSFTKNIKVVPKSTLTWVIISPPSNYIGSFGSVNEYTTSPNYTILLPFYTAIQFSYNLFIYFPAGSMPATGTYTLQSSATSLAPFTAFVALYPGPTNFVSGQLIVDYINGKLHISFTNITDSTGNNKLTAEIYKP